MIFSRSNKRFVPDKEFSGADRDAAPGRSGPVQFQKEEQDPFGLWAFLDTVKTAEKKDKRPTEDDRRDRRVVFSLIYFKFIFLISP